MKISEIRNLSSVADCLSGLTACLRKGKDRLGGKNAHEKKVVKEVHT